MSSLSTERATLVNEYLTSVMEALMEHQNGMEWYQSSVTPLLWQGYPESTIRNQAQTEFDHLVAKQAANPSGGCITNAIPNRSGCRKLNGRC